jgi:dipeptidyl aminopeptidase/acylaminoacyl peptidase
LVELFKCKLATASSKRGKVLLVVLKDRKESEFRFPYFLESKVMLKQFKLTLLVGCLIAGSSLAFAQTTATKTYANARDVPTEVFFALEDYRAVRMSPDGKRFAAIAPYRGRGNLVVIDIDTRKAQGITASDRWDVFAVRWIGNNRLYFTVADGDEVNGRPKLRGIFSINADGTDLREIAGYDNATLGLKGDLIDEVLAPVGGDSPEAFVSMNGRSRESADVYKYNFKTGRKELVSFDSPGRVAGWLLDSKNRPRVAARSSGRAATGKPMMEQFVYRGPDGGTWQVLFENAIYTGDELFGVCGFDKEEKLLYVTARQGEDKAGLWLFDPNQKKFLKKLISDPIVDLECALRSADDGDSSGGNGSLLVDQITEEIIGFEYQADRVKRVFFDGKRDPFYERITASFPGQEVAFRWNKDRNRASIKVVSDTNPGEWYLYSKDKDQVEFVARAREWVKPTMMAQRQFIVYTARDGMKIPAYLTLPRGVPAKNLPLIVNIHGGPWTRSYGFSEWGRWPEAQYFASRGYAVLEPEPRGSTGWGRKHLSSSFKQWGLSMQDDITDGALHLVKEGTVDKSRMCLHGGSYGGYASLQGLVRDPGLFKCANSFIAVTDLGLFQTIAYSDTAQNLDFNFFENEFKVLVGDRSADAALFQANSPARNAEKIQAPVRLTMGSDDVRVPLAHGERMRDALVKAGKPIEWKVYAGEGHGYTKLSNIIDFYEGSIAFFDKHIGKKGQAEVKRPETAN